MLKAKLVLERLDSHYRVLERREQPSRSFVLNFINLLYCAHVQVTDASPLSMKDISNTARTVDSQTVSGPIRGSKANLRIGSSPGICGVFCCCGNYVNPYRNILQETIAGEKIGIVVGTGVNAVTPTDVALQTRVEHGRGAGQLEYGGCELINIVIADPDGEFTVRRYFTNASGGSITINEAGIYSPGTDFGGYWAWPFCIARDLVSPGVTVNNNEILRVTYVVQITV